MLDHHLASMLSATAKAPTTNTTVVPMHIDIIHVEVVSDSAC
jgi:hypothetical protein